MLGECSDVDIRPTALNTTVHGDYLEICMNSSWIAVCDHGGMWTTHDAAVVCRQLGHSAMGKFATPL